MPKLVPQSYNNFSGGYTREEAVFTQKSCNFIHGSQNIEILASDNQGYGFEAMIGNTEFFQINGEVILGLYTYKTLTDEYLIIYTDAGKIYEYDEVLETPILIHSGLSLLSPKMAFDNITIGQLVGDPLMMGYFTNGVDAPFVYIKGATPEIQTVTAIDAEGRTLKGTNCISFNGSIWMTVKNRLHWSKSLDPFEWATADDAGYKDFDSEIKAMHVYSGYLIISTDREFYRVVSNGDLTYSFYPYSGGASANKDCLIGHGKWLLTFSGEELFELLPNNQDTTLVENSLSYAINADLVNVDINNCSLLNVTVHGRNEVWLHIQGDTTSTIYINRYKKGYQVNNYWLPPRIQQKINCIAIFKDYILSGTDDGKVLKELTGSASTFDGVFYASKAITPKINFGNYTGKQKCTPVLFLSGEKNNTFAGQYIVNGDISTPIRFDIVCNNADSLIWDVGNWDVDSWATTALTRKDLDRVSCGSKETESSLQIIFETKKLTDDFYIKSMDLIKIKKKQK